MKLTREERNEKLTLELIDLILKYWFSDNTCIYCNDKEYYIYNGSYKITEGMQATENYCYKANDEYVTISFENPAIYYFAKHYKWQEHKTKFYIQLNARFKKYGYQYKVMDTWYLTSYETEAENDLQI